MNHPLFGLVTPINDTISTIMYAHDKENDKTVKKHEVFRGKSKFDWKSHSLSARCVPSLFIMFLMMNVLTFTNHSIHPRSPQWSNISIMHTLMVNVVGWVMIIGLFLTDVLWQCWFYFIITVIHSPFLLFLSLLEIYFTPKCLKRPTRLEPKTIKYIHSFLVSFIVKNFYHMIHIKLIMKNKKVLYSWTLHHSIEFC